MDGTCNNPARFGCHNGMCVKCGVGIGEPCCLGSPGAPPPCSDPMLCSGSGKCVTCTPLQNILVRKNELVWASVLIEAAEVDPESLRGTLLMPSDDAFR